MTTLDRHIIRAVLVGVAMVAGVLLTLGGLFLFLGQQDDIGVGSYSTLDALGFVLLNLPQQAWELLPISALIGALLGLGTLARGSEFVVMRAAGLSVWRIALSVLMAGLLLGGFGAVLGEVLAPPMQQLAKQQKAFAKFSDVSFAGSGGAWVRDGNLIFNVERQSGENQFGGMVLYELSPDHELVAVGRASSARAGVDGTWSLAQYAESRFDADRVVASRVASRAIESNLSAEFLGIASSDPQQLPSAVLLRMVRHLEANGLDSREATYALWSRVARSIAVVAALMLALPFVFGSLRGSSAGARTSLGLVIGIGFFLLQRMLESGGVVFDASPVVLAWIPTALMGGIATVLLARTR
jgi:lipopolysaccharide export system permease protein